MLVFVYLYVYIVMFNIHKKAQIGIGTFSRIHLDYFLVLLIQASSLIILLLEYWSSFLNTI